MAFLDEIATLVDVSTSVGSGTSWPIYKSHLPDSTAIGDRAIALIEITGQGQLPGPDIDRRGLRVLVRGAAMSSDSTSYSDAESIAISIRDDLVGYAGSSNTDSQHYVGIWALTGPSFRGWDASWRPTISTDYRCWRSQD